MNTPLPSSLIINCSVYKDICEAPANFDSSKYSQAVFMMNNMKFIQSDELTHLRCLFELASNNGLLTQVHPPTNTATKHYAEGMGLFKGFDLPGTQFPNNPNSSYIPLTKIDSDRNDFLYAEFQKIFNKLNMPQTVVPDLCLAFTEIADNIYFHSGFTDNTGWGYIAAQVYRNKVVMSFTDTGTGFERAYERSGTRRGRTNLELLSDSLNYLESRFNIPGAKATRGFGLHEACNLARASGGSLVLRSANGMISVTGKSQAKQHLTNWLFCGTQVKMEVPI